MKFKENVGLECLFVRRLLSLSYSCWLSPVGDRPVRLTQGPSDYGAPMPSRDGRTIFANGTRTSGELVRCPEGSNVCAPYLGGPFATGVSFSRDALRLRVYDISSQRWRTLLDAEAYLSYPTWAEDGEHALVSEGNTRVRVNIHDGRKEVVVDFGELRRLQTEWAQWVGHAPDGSVLTLRDTSLDEVFALELETP